MIAHETRNLSIYVDILDNSIALNDAKLSTLKR